MFDTEIWWQTTWQILAHIYQIPIGGLGMWACAFSKAPLVILMCTEMWGPLKPSLALPRPTELEFSWLGSVQLCFKKSSLCDSDGHKTLGLSAWDLMVHKLVSGGDKTGDETVSSEHGKQGFMGSQRGVRIFQGLVMVWRGSTGNKNPLFLP